MRCESCSKHKQTLRARKSKLSNRKMLVCNDCFERQYEPRWLIIITGQQDGGLDKIKNLLLNHQYYGPEISAADILPE